MPRRTWLYLFLLAWAGLIVGGLVMLTLPANAQYPQAGAEAQAGNVAPRNAPLGSTPTPTTTPCGWFIVPSPNISSINRLQGMTAVSANNVWAVGYYVSGTARQTLVERWNGTTWNFVTSPNQGANNNVLNGIDAIAANDMWAVGYYFNGNVNQTLTMRWNGTAWTIISSPNNGTTNNNVLTSVSAVSSNDVWAVGYSIVGGVRETLTLHWDGTAWTIVTSPNPSTSYNELLGVTALGPNDVWAVGDYFVSPTYLTLTMHWDGSAWSVVASPNVSSSFNALNGVDATSPSDVWAVGASLNGATYATLVLYWNGANWVTQTSLNGPGSSVLQAVDALTATDVWAVGYTVNAPNEQTLIEHWNGSTWAIIPSPNPSADNTRLLGVVALSATDAWAAGYSRTGALEQTLTEHFIGSCASPTPTVTGTPPTNTPTRTPTNTPTATNTPCGFTQPLSEGFESGTLGVFTSSGSPGWSAVNTASHSGTFSAFAPNVAAIADQRLTTNNAITVPANASIASFTFWHRYTFEANFDGGVLEYSTDNGNNWNDAGPNITSGGYNGTISTCCGNPLSGRNAWVGTNGTNFTQVVVNLLPYVGQDVLMRYRLGTDNVVGSTGWWVDDVLATTARLTCESPTPTVTGTPPTATPTRTPTSTATATHTRTPTSTPTITPTATNTPTPTHTSTRTVTRTVTSTFTPTNTPTITPTGTNTPTRTITPTATNTGTNTPTGQPTNTATPLFSRTPAPSATPGCVADWRLVSSPNVGTTSNNMRAIAAIAPNDIWAVGTYRAANGIDETLTMHWNGSDWTVVPSPNRGNRYNALQGVAAVAGNDVWAVGYYYDTNNVRLTLAMHWDGTAWSLVTTPSPGPDYTYLWSVTALASNDVWAVGNRGFNGGTVTLHWDGTAWSVVASPVTSGLLFGVDAVSANDIWAVGYYTPITTPQTLIEHWDGTAWSQIPSPNIQPNEGHTLYSVSAFASDDVWAVGYHEALNGVVRSHIQHWNGTAWSIVPSPNGAQLINYLYGVVATSPTDAWAVGTYRAQSGLDLTLTMRWNGTAWNLVPSPNVATDNNYLNAVVALSPNNVWAVGDEYHQNSPYRTLLQHWDGQCNTPTPSATATPCPIQFIDVDQTNPFYTFIRCLACRQIVSGYSDGTFRWGVDVTRGQLSKIIAQAANLAAPIPSSQQTFTDVPNTNAFWLFIERLSGVGAISGYGCGGPGEPCDPSNRPYFRWGNQATRGQISKITAVTAGWNGPIPTTQQTFTDVTPTNAFWVWIEELASRQIISGYNCGGPGEPCDPQNRAYFRWGNNATRGQMSKIAASAFFPNCQTPARR